MPLHDAVGINCKGATTENQDSAVKYMGWVYVDDCVPDLTPCCREKVMVYYFIYYNKIHYRTGPSICDQATI